MKLKKLMALSVAVLMIVVFTGCGKKKLYVNSFNANADYYGADVEIAAENSLYAVFWDDENGAVSFLDKTSGKVWGAAPVDSNSQQQENPNFKAPIIVKYVENETYIDKTLNAYTGSIRKSTYSAELFQNGITVTYYFEDAEIAIPVSYVVGEDGFHMYIETAKIQENSNRIYSIAFMPFLAGVGNELTSKQGYLFAPSGSGALIYPKTTGDGIGITVTDEVFGRDYNNNYTDKTNVTDVKLPVFGSKSRDTGVCGILEYGAETATLAYNIGSQNLGYSTVYPVFNIRGSYYCTLNVMNSKEQALVYSDERIRNKIGVLYVPLNAENADYMGMADCYRNYLINNKALKNTDVETLLNIKLVGGTMVRKYAFGIPYNSLHVTTSFSEAANIINDLNTATEEKLNVNLIGFSKSGITPNEIAGGYTYNGKFGSIKELDSIKDIADCFFDFDIVNCASDKISSLGSNVSLNLSKKKQVIKQIDFVSGSVDNTAQLISLISRDNLGVVLSKAISKTEKKNMTGISLSTLSNTAYSDYRGNRYVAKAYMSAQVEALLNGVSKSGLKLATSAANEYAAYGSDHIFDAPTMSARYQIFDCDIPFYEIVFKGYVSMSVNSINVSDDRQKALLGAVETGIGLTYTIIDDYDTLLINSKENLFYNSKYSDIKAEIKESVLKFKELFHAVEGQTVTEHSVVNKDVRVTEFSNGVKVCVNYGSDAFQINGKAVSARNFAIIEGGD